jgi:hypothetical protein
MWNMMRGRQPIKIDNPHLIRTKNYERSNWLKSARDENIELGIPIGIGQYENERVKIVVNSALKNIKPEDNTPVQKLNKGKDKSEIRLLEKFKDFGEDDKDYWLAHYKIDSDVFAQIYSIFNNVKTDDDNFYFSADMRRMVIVIVFNHLGTNWPNDWRVPREEETYVTNYLIDTHKDNEVIGVIKILNEENGETESVFRIYENGRLLVLFTSKYFDLKFFKPYDEMMEILEDQLVRVNKDGKEGNEMENIHRCIMLTRLLRKYHQGWSLFFSEDAYRDELFEEDYDDGVIVAQLEKLNKDFNRMKHFNLDDSETLTDGYLALRDPENKFMTTKFTITTIITGKGVCSICKKPIVEKVEGQVELPCRHKFHFDCLYAYMMEIQECPVCHIFIHLKKGEIINKNSNNWHKPDKSLVKYVKGDKLLPHTATRTIRWEDSKTDARLNKKEYVLAKDSYIAYPRDECLYYWFSKGQPVVACAVRHDLQGVLLTPFMQKTGQWRRALNISRKVRSWDGVTSYKDYWGDLSENAYVEDATLKMLVYGKPIFHDGVYEQ